MRRRWSAEAKARIIALSFEPRDNIAEIARTHGLLPQQLYVWRFDAVKLRRLDDQVNGSCALPAYPSGAPRLVVQESERS